MINQEIKRYMGKISAKRYGIHDNFGLVASLSLYDVVNGHIKIGTYYIHNHIKVYGISVYDKPRNKMSYE